MVAKRIASTAGAGAGGFAGGFFNNPGVVIGLGLVTAIVAGLLLFQNDIRKFFGDVGEGFGQIQLPSINLPDITFPSFEFPDIKFPDITFPSFDIDFPSFDFQFPDFGQMFEDFSKQFVPEERQDVPFGDTEQIIDVVPDVTGGRAGRLAGVIDSFMAPLEGSPEFIGPTQPFSLDRFLGLTPAQEFAIEERGATLESLGITTFGEGPVVLPQMETLGPDPREFIATSQVILEETQAEFQERSESLAEQFPGTFFSTSLTDEITTGRQLSRESEDFQDVLDAEARRSEAIFASLFGNVQNPDFGA